MKKMIGCCGIDCEKCDVYIATKNDDNALREKTAEMWSRLNNVNITPDMLYCTGCRCDGVKTYYCSDTCKIRKCVKDNGFETCSECEKMSSCETVAMIHNNNREALDNLKNFSNEENNEDTYT